MWAHDFIGLSIVASMLAFFLVFAIMCLAIIALVVYIKNNTSTPAVSA